jgi:DNA polymerase-3 subunit epsilon
MNIREARFSSLDLETTGLNPQKDEIIAIGIVPLEGLKILSSNSFYSLVKPKKVKIKTLKIHGISQEKLEKAPCFDEIYPKIRNILEGSILVGFCVELDYSFLKNASKNFNAEKIDVVKVDRALSRFLGEKYLESPDLDSLAKKYGLKTPFRHNALADAFITAQIFQIQLLRLLKVGINTVEKLMSIINEPEQPIL